MKSRKRIGPSTFPKERHVPTTWRTPTNGAFPTAHGPRWARNRRRAIHCELSPIMFARLLYDPVHSLHSSCKTREKGLQSLPLLLPFLPLSLSLPDFLFLFSFSSNFHHSPLILPLEISGKRYRFPEISDGW